MASTNSGNAVLWVASQTTSDGSSPGAIASSGGTLTYTPAANFTGSDSFTFTITDSVLTATGTVLITVLPINVPTLVETESGTATAASSVTTSKKIKKYADDLYLAFVSADTGVTDTTVTGLGMSWTRLTGQCSAGGNGLVSVWWMIYDPGHDLTVGNSSGTVTAQLSAAANNSSLIVMSLSGIDSTQWPGPFASANNGGGISCATSAASTSVSLSVGNVAVGSLVVTAIAQAGATASFSADSRAAVTSASPDSVGSNAVTSQGTATTTATASSAVDWSAITVAVPGL
jgi:hypothetical protein